VLIGIKLSNHFSPLTGSDLFIFVTHLEHRDLCSSGQTVFGCLYSISGN